MPKLITLDETSALEHFFGEGWTDGLPVTLPTPERVTEMIGDSGYDPSDVLGGIAVRQVDVTAEDAAVAAVMAGCRPVHYPLVVAAVSAMLDPRFNLAAVLTSTGGAAIVVLVSGPMAQTAGMNARGNAFGPGNRANLTIGRALRLLCINVLGSRPGETDLSSFGHPGRLSFCFAEDPPRGWDPIRVDLGYTGEDTTVTVLPGESPRQVANHLTDDPEAILRTIASALAGPWHFPVGKGFQAYVVLGPEHADAVIGAGWSRRDVQVFLYEASRVTQDDITRWGVLIETGGLHDMTPGPDGKLPSLATVDDVLVVTAGGAGPGWSAVIPCWGTKHQRAHIVTRRVRPPGEELPECGPDGCSIAHRHTHRPRQEARR
ncbi:hypothetical protein [Plantactinospora sp. GCM10030261]|uniref:hypothetical protein n=1 Tax=Plantactinospora sp. GCM10030261 TaxID=3273420 RepID=UPI003612B9B0